MKYKFWLIFDGDGGVAVRKRAISYGDLGENQVAVPVTFNVPDSRFATQRSHVLEFNLPNAAHLEDVEGEVGAPLEGDDGR